MNPMYEPLYSAAVPINKREGVTGNETDIRKRIKHGKRHIQINRDSNKSNASFTHCFYMFLTHVFVYTYISGVYFFCGTPVSRRGGSVLICRGGYGPVP